MQLLTCNVGGATAKLAAYDLAEGEPRRLDGLDLRRDLAWSAAAFATEIVVRSNVLADQIETRAWDAVAHRIVHGGPQHRHAALLDSAVREAILQATPLAPLHNPAALAVADQIAARLPGLPQVAVFDTNFFADPPDVASGYAPPRSLSGARDLVRYGYHGLAHAAMWEAASSVYGSPRPRRVISPQLGSGASVAVVRDGRALDVSMGYSTLEGLVMGTRCGDLDPGAVLHLLRQPGSDPQRLADQLALESGLLGLSGRSAHVHELLDADDDASRHALDLYVYRAAMYLGSYLAVLGGVDAIVFGGGVEERSPVIRSRFLAPFGFAGIVLDAARSSASTSGSREIGVPGGEVRILTAAVDEARQLALAASQLVDR